MPATYTFRYPHGQSMPYKTLEARDDGDFFETQLPAWEKKTGFKHAPGTVICTVSETRKVPEQSAKSIKEPGRPPDCCNFC